MASFEVVKGNIVDLFTEAIVNAANSKLKPGAGVCGAIYEAAGPELKKETDAIGWCEPGEAVITKGYNLFSQYIIHTVAPIYKDGNHGESEILKNCYKSVMDIVIEKNLNSVAFPSLGTGIYGNPLRESAEIAIDTVSEYLKENDIKVYFVCFDNETYNVYEEIKKSKED